MIHDVAERIYFAISLLLPLVVLSFCRFCICFSRLGTVPGYFLAATSDKSRRLTPGARSLRSRGAGKAALIWIQAGRLPIIFRLELAGKGACGRVGRGGRGVVVVS